MKKRVLVLLTLVPVVSGYLYNLLLGVPILTTVLIYAMPLAIIIFWFWLGVKFSASGWNILSATLIANATGIASAIAMPLLPNIYQRFATWFANDISLYAGKVAVYFYPWLIKNTMTIEDGRIFTEVCWRTGFFMMVMIFVLGHLAGYLARRTRQAEAAHPPASR